MNTAMGNCLISCALMFGMMSHLKIPSRDYELINNGDDCCIITRPQHQQVVINSIPGYFAKAGFKMKVESPVASIEQIEFCQTHPVFDG